MGKLKRPYHLFIRSGRNWKLPQNTASKGEISTRSKNNPLTPDGLNLITPPDPAHPEFGRVSELRASFSSDNFFVFSLGFLKAARLADLVKAKERFDENAQLSPTETSRANRWVSLINSINLLLNRRHFPAKIQEIWSDQDWIKYARLATDSADPDNLEFQTSLRSLVFQTLTASP